MFSGNTAALRVYRDGIPGALIVLIVVHARCSLELDTVCCILEVGQWESWKDAFCGQRKQAV
jgi:hypothetical protein